MGLGRNHLKEMISVAEYRKILQDEKTSDGEIKKKIQYLETFCRNIIKVEINEYVKKGSKHIPIQSDK